jgi:hypothetical protein
MKHRVTVWTYWNKIPRRIDHSAGSSYRDGCDVMYVNEAFTYGTVRLTEVKTANDAAATLNFDAGRTIKSAALIALRDDFDYLTLNLASDRWRLDGFQW